MSPPIPPNPSPGPPFTPDRDKEPTTGEYLAAAAENVVREFSKGSEKKSFLTGFLGFAGSIVGAIGIAFGVYFAVLGQAQAQVDAGVRNVKQQADNTQGDLDRYKKENDARFNRLEHQGDRNETKLDALLNRFSVPNPAPKPPDAGTP